MEKTVSVVQQSPKLPRRERVAAYARVSLSKDAMLHSLAAQVDYYSKLIQSNPLWLYAGVYADSGLTGTKDDRPEFQRLLTDCRAGKIDIVLVKSISRFARNTVTLLEVVRELHTLGIDIYFEEQNIHTLSGDGELMLSILASFAQEESRSVSENCRWRVQEKFSKGEVTGMRMFGYRLSDGVLTIVPEEATVVHLIFELFLGGLGKESITKELNDRGIPSPYGKTWHPNTVIEILRNEKYAGNMLLQKTFIEDHLSKRQHKNKGERPQYWVQESHEAVIDPNTFEAVQEELKRRADAYTFKPRHEVSIFSGLITCGHCGHKFSRKKQYGNTFWLCYKYVHGGKQACKAKRIREEVLRTILCEVLDTTEDDLDSQIHRVEEIVVFADGHLKVTADGVQYDRPWANPSRSESWTPEMRAKAAEDVKKRHLKQSK